jgi:hypothetical protein
MLHTELRSGGVEVSEVPGDVSGEVLEATTISGCGVDVEVRSEPRPINVPDAVLSATGATAALSLVGHHQARPQPHLFHLQL